MIIIEKLILDIKPEVKARKSDDNYRTFSIRIKEKTVKKLDIIAAKTGRTRNELIGIFLDYSADNCVIKEEEEP
nr:ribbon-helix-helix protein, CopG family [uncultured Oscillibacter sp.]